MRFWWSWLIFENSWLPHRILKLWPLIWTNWIRGELFFDCGTHHGSLSEGNVFTFGRSYGSSIFKVTFVSLYSFSSFSVVFLVWIWTWDFFNSVSFNLRNLLLFVGFLVFQILLLLILFFYYRFKHWVHNRILG